MCLSFVVTTPHTLKEWKYGWKIFIQKGEYFYPYIMEIPKMKVGQWYEDDRTDVICMSLPPYHYKPGFHFFPNELEAKAHLMEICGPENWDSYVVKKIEVDQVVAHGEQDLRKVSVARRIKICV